MLRLFNLGFCGALIRFVTYLLRSRKLMWCCQMTKVKCPSVECKHNHNQKCTLKEITLSWSSVMTMHQGRQEFWKCNEFALSNESMRLFKQIEEMMQKGCEQ